MNDFIAPAPWQLKGSGIIIPYYFSKQWLLENFPHVTGRIGAVMCVNYTESPVGPYREWMFIPGKRQSPLGPKFSIQNIVVDSPESVVGGQQNWGIPKELGRFDWHIQKGNWHLSMQSDKYCLSLKGREKGISLPIHSGLLPFELYQQRLEKQFYTKPVAKGWGKWMKLSEYQYTVNGEADLNQQKPLCAFAIPEFSMTFPVAKTV